MNRIVSARVLTGELGRGVKRRGAGVIKIGGAYIYTAWEALVGEHEFEPEFKPPRLESAVAAQDLFILKERRMAISVVFEVAPALGGESERIDIDLSGGGGVLEGANIAMETDSQMRDAKGFQNGKDDAALHSIAGGVLPMGLVETDMEVGNVSCFRTQGPREPGQEGGLGGRFIGGDAVGGVVEVGTHLFDVFPSADGDARVSHDTARHKQGLPSGGG